MFCGEMTDLIDKGEQCVLCDWIFFGMVSCKIIVEKLLKFGLDEEVVRCAEDCLAGSTGTGQQRVVGGH